MKININKASKVILVASILILVGSGYNLILSFNKLNRINSLSYDFFNNIPEPYLEVNVTMDNSSHIYIVNTTNSFFPFDLYYRNGSLAGWFYNGNFTREFPFDLWIYFNMNDTDPDPFIDLMDGVY